MTTLVDIMNNVFQAMPENTRFSESDAQKIQENSTVLLDLGDGLISGFYNTVFSHTATASVFEDNERPMREKSLTDWWKRTVNGPFSDEYWAWQTYVGLLHIKRGVSNPMMMSMWSWILDYLNKELVQAGLSETETNALVMSFQRLSSTTSSLIGDSVFRFYLEALINATGFKSSLLERMVKNEIDQLLQDNAQYRLT